MNEVKQHKMLCNLEVPVAIPEYKAVGNYISQFSIAVTKHLRKST
jgi:hypothetical protein